MKFWIFLLLILCSTFAVSQVPPNSTLDNPAVSGNPYPSDLVSVFDVSVQTQEYDCGTYQFCQEIDPALYWGVVADECPEASLPSGILYSFPPNQTVVLSQVVNLGEIASRNVIIFSDPGNPDMVILILDVNINGIDLDIEVELMIDETVNAEPCPYVLGTPNEIPCSDRHSYTIPEMEIFTIGNHTYELDFAFPGVVDVIIPELCQPEMVVPNGFQGVPTPLPAYITCVDCCDIYFWFDDVAHMYIPHEYHIQRAPGFQEGETIYGDIIFDGPSFVVLENVVVLSDQEEFIFEWAAYGILPGEYQVTLDIGSNLGPIGCGSGWVRIVVPADYWPQNY